MLDHSENPQLQKQKIKRIPKKLRFITLSLLRENQKSNLVGAPLWPFPRPIIETPPMTKTYSQPHRGVPMFVIVLNQSKNQWFPKEMKGFAKSFVYVTLLFCGRTKIESREGPLMALPKHHD